MQKRTENHTNSFSHEFVHVQIWFVKCSRSLERRLHLPSQTSDQLTLLENTEAAHFENTTFKTTLKYDLHVLESKQTARFTVLEYTPTVLTTETTLNLNKYEMS